MGRQIENVANLHDDASEHSGLSLSLSQRTVLLHGELSESQSNLVLQQLMFLAEQSNQPIKLVISTYGGNIDEMFGIYDIMKYIKCEIHTVAIGKVMSAGVLLLAAGKKGERMIGRNARLMVHSASSGFQGSIFYVKNEVEELARVQEQLITCMLNETKIKRAKLEKIMAQGFDQYITASDAVSFGFADQIIG